MKTGRRFRIRQEDWQRKGFRKAEGQAEKAKIK
jgi:hypothetical protein